MGISSKLNGTYLPPAVEFTSENYRTVFDAISDLQDIQTSTDVSAQPVELDTLTDIPDLAKQLCCTIMFLRIPKRLLKSDSKH